MWCSIWFFVRVQDSISFGEGSFDMEEHCLLSGGVNVVGLKMNACFFAW